MYEDKVLHNAEYLAELMQEVAWYVTILYSWVRASWIKFNNCPTRCDSIQFIKFLQAALYVSGVDTHHQELLLMGVNIQNM